MSNNFFGPLNLTEEVGSKLGLNLKRSRMDDVNNETDPERTDSEDEDERRGYVGKGKRVRVKTEEVEVVSDAPRARRKKVVNPKSIRDTISITPGSFELSKSDLCIGHAMSNTYGAGAQQLRNEVRYFGDHRVVKGLYDHMIESTKPGFEENKITVFHPKNIRKHATRIFSYTNNGKTYMWYNNPWGHVSDLRRFNGADNHFVADILDKSNPPETIEEAVDITNEEFLMLDAEIHISPSPQKADFSHAVAYSVAKVAKYAGVNRGSLKRFMAWWYAMGGMYHIMTTVYFLKLSIEAGSSNPRAVRFEILHPTQSMPDVGVQLKTRDGRFDIIDSCNIEGVGACSVWAEMYGEWASTLLSEANGLDNNIRNVLYTYLPNIGEIGVQDARYLLGRFYFHSVTQKLLAEEQRGSRGRKSHINIVSQMITLFSRFYDNIRVNVPGEDPEDTRKHNYHVVTRAHKLVTTSMSGMNDDVDMRSVMIRFFDDMGICGSGEIAQFPVKKRYMTIMANTCVILVACKHRLRIPVS